MSEPERTKEPDAMLSEVGRLLAERRFDPARDLCLAALQSFPDHADVFLRLAQVETQAGKAQAALEALKSAARAAPARVEVQVAMGDGLLAVRRFTEAADCYRGALRLEADRGALLGRLAVALQEAGSLEEAVNSYREAITLSPHDPLLHYNLGTALKRLHRFDDALEAYSEACRLAPEDAELELCLANFLVETSRFDEAVKRLERVVAARPESLLALSQLSYAHKKLANGQASVDAARRLVDVTGGTLPALMALSSALLTLGDAEGALSVCEQGLARAPASRQLLSDKAIALSALDRKEEAGHLVDFGRLLMVSEIDTPEGFETIDEFNAALLDHIRTHPSLDFSGISLSCHHGATSDELLIEPKGPVGLLENAINQAAAAYVARQANRSDHPWAAYLPHPERFELSAWATLLRSQGYQHGHIHPSAWLSGVYYVHLPSVVGADDGDQSGWIEFGRAPFFYACQDQHAILPVKPREGMIALFPSYFYHRTIPFESTEERITVAFDFRLPVAASG